MYLKIKTKVYNSKINKKKNKKNINIKQIFDLKFI
jgi:hypothetical protein